MGTAMIMTMGMEKTGQMGTEMAARKMEVYQVCRHLDRQAAIRQQKWGRRQ
ncbi:MAG: hypothetical protein WAM27_03190 [Nitrososphaeraceae archaeon]